MRNETKLKVRFTETYFRLKVHFDYSWWKFPLRRGAFFRYSLSILFFQVIDGGDDAREGTSYRWIYLPPPLSLPPSSSRLHAHTVHLGLGLGLGAWARHTSSRLLSSTYSYSSSSSSPPSAHLSLADSGPIPPLLLLSVLRFCSTLSYVLSVERVPSPGGPITLPVFPSFSLLPVRQLFQRGFYYALRVPLNNPASFFAFSLCGTGLH